MRVAKMPHMRLVNDVWQVKVDVPKEQMADAA